MYGSEKMLWREKERSRMRAEQMDNFRGLLGIRRMDRVPNAQIRELCGVMWYGHVERMERDRIAKRVYVGECADSSSVGRPRKKWIETVKECLKKSGLNIRQAKRMVQDMSVWRGFVRWNAWGVARGMNP